MTHRVFLQRTKFPAIWLELNLLPAEYFATSIPEFLSEYGDRKPEGGTEHWRFGAFLFLLRKGVSEEQVPLLVEAAIEDPDKPMAGGVIEELLSLSCASNQCLEKACAAVGSSKYYYKTPEQLRLIFQSSKGPYASRP